MGRDGTPRQRQKADLARRRGQRRAYDRILIVCEGSKTEPLYFKEICSACRLPTANIVVRPSELGTAPIQVVQYARQLFEHGDRHRSIVSRAFERVYAVFDRDDHASFHAALRLAESLDGNLRNDEKKAPTFRAIASIPSFELWLLLHFEDVLAPLHRDEVMQRLKQHLPGYDKGAGRSFEATESRLDEAARRARQLAARCVADNDSEPYTGIGELVELLMNLRRR